MDKQERSKLVEWAAGRRFIDVDYREEPKGRAWVSVRFVEGCSASYNLPVKTAKALYYDLMEALPPEIREKLAKRKRKPASNPAEQTELEL